MKEKILLLMCLSLLTAFTAFAQTRTVTNSNLEKYRSKRVQAERDLRENYERLGFPSPEELAERQEKSRIETIALADKLRAERLERAKLAAEVRMAEAAAQATRLSSVSESYYPLSGGYYGGGFLSYGYVGGRHRNRGLLYRADASGVIYEPGSRPASIWAPRVNRPRPIRTPRPTTRHR